jgi:hypothetical protein
MTDAASCTNGGYAQRMYFAKLTEGPALSLGTTSNAAMHPAVADIGLISPAFWCLIRTRPSSESLSSYESTIANSEWVPRLCLERSHLEILAGIF